MTFFVDVPKALQLVDGEYFPLTEGGLGVDLDVRGRTSSTFDFDLDLIAPGGHPVGG